MSEEIIVNMLADPDFGEIALVELRSAVSVDGGPSESIAYRMWMGEKGPDRTFRLILVNDEDPPQVPHIMRECFRKTMADIHGLRSRVAVSELALARDWAEQGDLDIELDAPKLAGLLTLDGVEIGDERLTVYFAEDADIFEGHVLEVRINPDGEIREIVLAG